MESCKNTWTYGLDWRGEWLEEQLTSCSLEELRRRCIEAYLRGKVFSFKVSYNFCKVFGIKVHIKQWKSEQVQNEIKTYLDLLGVRVGRFPFLIERKNDLYNPETIAVCRFVVRAGKEELIRFYQEIVGLVTNSCIGDNFGIFWRYKEELSRLGYFDYCKEFYRKDKGAS